MLGLVQHAKAYERLAIESAVTGDRTTALKALLTNPLGPAADRAQALLDVLLEENRSNLPRFFPQG
jgi:6-phospho-beta-glucosidase